MIDSRFKNITTKQFQLLSDINLVWDFLVETYDWKNDSGRPAPFFEYAITATWMDSSYSFLDRFWFDGDKVVAFAYYEAPDRRPKRDHRRQNRRPSLRTGGRDGFA